MSKRTQKHKHSANQGRRQIMLWELMVELLADPATNPSVMAWTDYKHVCKITDPLSFAARWGEIKNNPNMKFESIARALRLYKKRGQMVPMTDESWKDINTLYHYKFGPMVIA
jgi:hypothetical protein